MPLERSDYQTSPLQVALTQLGVTEDRGNRGEPYRRYAITGEDPLPWCARFVRWCFTQAGIRLPGNRYFLSSVHSMKGELSRMGAMLTPRMTPEPGDLIFLKSRDGSDVGPGQHVGIVESCGAVTVNSIDGNWGDAVKRVARARGDRNIACYARWPVRPAA